MPEGLFMTMMSSSSYTISSFIFTGSIFMEFSCSISLIDSSSSLHSFSFVYAHVSFRVMPFCVFFQLDQNSVGTAFSLRNTSIVLPASFF